MVKMYLFFFRLGSSGLKVFCYLHFREETKKNFPKPNTSYFDTKIQEESSLIDITEVCLLIGD